MWVVDRIEGDRVVLVPDGEPESAVEVAREDLREGVEEGCVLRVEEGAATGTAPLADGTTPEVTRLDWSRAVIDVEETARRRGDAAAQLERLKKRDPGGDITL